MPFFDLGGFELLFIAIVTLLVVGPKDLPKVMRVVGRVAGKVKGAARQFRSGLDDMMREAELDEMRQKWDSKNADIMRAHPGGVPTDMAAASEPLPPSPPTNDGKTAAAKAPHGDPPPEPRSSAKPGSKPDPKPGATPDSGP